MLHPSEYFSREEQEGCHPPFYGETLDAMPALAVSRAGRLFFISLTSMYYYYQLPHCLLEFSARPDGSKKKIQPKTSRLKFFFFSLAMHLKLFRDVSHAAHTHTHGKCSRRKNINPLI